MRWGKTSRTWVITARSFLLAATALTGGFVSAFAQQAPTNAGSVSTDAAQGSSPTEPYSFAPPAPGSAADSAPSRAPLEAGQPTSIVGQTFIQNSTIPAQNYDELVKFTPSLMNIQPAGPVSQQNYGESIRGFQYNQFNTTFDGIVIPGTISNFAPQSATYFTSHDLGSINVDRGPGTASTIGYATFGGTIGLESKEPLDVFTVTPYATFGSFDQKQAGLEIDSGAIPQLGGGRGFFDISRLTTDAYVTGTTTDRTNLFGKWEQPIGESTTVTAVGMLNYSYGHTPYGSTLAQITKFGPDYGLNNDPGSQDFAGYNTDVYNTDFEYIRIASDLGGGWRLEETPYTASYFRRGTEGADPNGTTPNLGEPGGSKEYIDGVRVDPTDDVPGVSKHNDFRDYGSVTRLVKDTPWGELRAGLWFDYVDNGVYRTKIDFSRGDEVYTTKPGVSAFNQFYHDYLTTVQPYIEFAWKPLPGLTITPGVRFDNVQRSLNVVVLSGAPLGKSNHTWDKAQPSVEVQYNIDKHWSTYGQVAVGFLTPPLNTLETTNPVGVTPQTTLNYQIGTAYQVDRASVAADAYYIPFQNFISSRTVDGEAIYTNDGSALYRGIELEGSYKLIQGLSVYANGTLNDARFADGAHIYQAPQHTAAFGPIYNGNSLILDRDNLYGSILLKNVGKQFGENIDGLTGPTVAYPIKSYSNVDLAVGYTLPVLKDKKVRIGVNLYNIFDNHSLIGFAGTTAAGTPLYWTDPGFSGFVTLSASL
jgi:iron complex outermembrane receptor protein